MMERDEDEFEHVIEDVEEEKEEDWGGSDEQADTVQAQRQGRAGKAMSSPFIQVQ